MEMESLFSSTRWDIIRLLSEKSSSPIELSEALKTTQANISQQLRLLELAGIVRSERTSSSDKGKPRVIYTIARDYSYLILASSSFSDKKLMPLSCLHSFILKSWFIEDIDLHPVILKFYCDAEPFLGKIDAIVFASKKEPELLIYTENQKEIPKFASLDRRIRQIVLSKEELPSLEKSKFAYHVLYDPNNLVRG